MNPLRQIGRWMLFVVRNSGRKPKYPFVDDGVDSPLELHIGPWGRTQWRDTEDRTLHEVVTVDDTGLISESIERDIYGSTINEMKAWEEQLDKECPDYEMPPHVIRFLKLPLETT